MLGLVAAIAGFTFALRRASLRIKPPIPPKAVKAGSRAALYATAVDHFAPATTTIPLP